jgi:uncharacterized protein (DUF488 family)
MNKQIIFTVGYTLFQNGNYVDLEKMFNVLRNYNVTYLVDVRSVPYSKQYPQCNADNLKIAGKRYGIPYLHMPEVGAKVSAEQDVFSKASDIFFNDIFPIPKSNRPEKTELFKDDEIVDFNKFRNDEYFLKGLKRIETAYEKDFTLCLMCSEKSPVDCHRYFLISKALEKKFGDWLGVQHIVQGDNGTISTSSNSELNNQLKELIFKKKEIKKLVNEPSSDLFNQSMDIPAVIDTYYGETRSDREADFCDRYWNLMHGWKKNVCNIKNSHDYD